MRLIIMGPPGAGQGHPGQVHRRALRDPGDLDRRHLPRQRVRRAPPLGVEAKRYMDAGEYVPDEVTNLMVRNRIDEPDAEPRLPARRLPAHARPGRGARRDDQVHRPPRSTRSSCSPSTGDEIVAAAARSAPRPRVAPTTPRTSSGAARRSTPSRPSR